MLINQNIEFKLGGGGLGPLIVLVLLNWLFLFQIKNLFRIIFEWIIIYS